MRRMLLAVFLAAVMLLSSVGVVYAMTTPGTVNLISATMYENVLRTGDEYLVAEYNISSANISDPVSITFLVRLMSDNGTEVGNSVIYAYKDLGYNRGVFSMYWLPDNPLKPTWSSDNYTLRLEGNPTILWVPTTPLVTLDSTSFVWKSAATLAATSYFFGLQIETIADHLSDYWTVDLLAAVATGGVNGNVFTVAGENYFTNAVPGIRSIAPSLFALSSSPVSHTDVPNKQTRSTTLAARRASLGLYEGTVWGIPTSLIYAFASIVISILFGAVMAAALAPLGGVVSQVGGGVVGVCLVLAFCPLLFVYVGMLAAVVEGILAFVAIIAIGLWMAGHLGRVF